MPPKQSSVGYGVLWEEKCIGSIGDSYDNALAKTINGLYKAEVTHKDGSWCGLDDAGARNIDLGGVVQQSPSAEFEIMYHQKIESSNVA